MHIFLDLSKVFNFLLILIVRIVICFAFNIIAFLTAHSQNKRDHFRVMERNQSTHARIIVNRPRLMTDVAKHRRIRLLSVDRSRIKMSAARAI